jgi:microcompartment protein CcmK/EutM
MLIARVIGELVATRKHQSHEGRKVLLVQPLSPMVRPRRCLRPSIVDAGVGDRAGRYRGWSADQRGTARVANRHGRIAVIDSAELAEPVS